MQEISSPASGSATDRKENLQRDLAYPILGKLAIENGLLTKEQLQQAIAEMHSHRETPSETPPPTLEEILLNRGYIQPLSMEKLLASTLRSLDRQFCSMAEKKGIVDNKTCEMALTTQAEAYRQGQLLSAADILIEKNQITPAQKDALLEQMRSASAPPSEENARASLADKWKEQDQKRQITKNASKIPPEEMAIARMALQYNFIHTEQLQSAIGQWTADQGSHKPRKLSQILMDLGFVSRKQISLLHATQLFHETRQMDQLFGRLCLIHNFCSKEEVLRGLDTQLAKFKRNRTIKLLGNILVEENILTHDQMFSLLREQKRIPDAQTPTPVPEERPSLPDNHGVTVEISEDGLLARLIPSPQISPQLSLDGLKRLLADAGVYFGLVPDSRLQTWLQETRLQQVPLEAAKGIPPEDPRDGHIRYGFDPAYLKAGKIDADGNIDYFDRGEVPFVKSRTLLGERIPPVEGKSGIKVTGEEALPREPVDVELRAGNGAELSLDGQMVHALIDGQPHATLGGKISVFPEMTIEGNVDLKTGHISFDGAIRIRGCVQPGFRVRAASADTAEVNDADIHVDGDLVVRGGIIGSRIRAGGNVHAKFVVDSEIMAFGNIVVEKEIIHSKIRTSGTLALPKGKLIACEAAARNGLEIYEVGTDMASPSTLFIGVDFYMQNEMTRLQNKSRELKQVLAKTQKQIESSEKQQTEIHQKIAENAQKQDKSQLLIQKLSALPPPPEKEQEILSHLANLKKTIEKTESTVTRLFAEQDKILDGILKNQKEAEHTISLIEETRSEYEALQDWSRSNPPKPILKVKGFVASGTCIAGSKARITLKESMRNMIFSEVQSTDYEGEPSWTIRMVNA
ncbi:uncharacterized protein (DUF342 family) [Desulfobotulus alkaliphilus]|uniref:Uncharacterized protein (DUF342 family) n=1 Tax=Desulfobotulus alkaliphilus TaxID=622671 RepID=A0A562RML2_9BACT|nr:FapA family protein [Desulfobotulus alkaliphilus]TWI70328.1 uncharacterized protein (DUF342 family) [Desulfobotulus alkaliphilus]